MGFFSFRKNKEKFVALFGIGSGSVGGALIHYTKDANDNWVPHIVAQERTYFKFQNELDFDNFFSNMQVALRATCEKIYNKKQGAPESIYCTMTSPWYISETRRVNFKKNSPFTVNTKILDDIINVELTSILKSYEEKYKGMQSVPYLLESKVLHTMLNGYEVVNPVGMKASSISMNLFLSICADSSIKNIKDIFTQVFHELPTHFNSFLLLMLIIARERLPDQASYFLMDINAEITDIGIVSNGVLVANISFPIGKNYIIRAISNNLKKDSDSARSMFTMYTDGTLSKEESMRLAPIMTNVRDEWMKFFKEALDSLPQTISISSNIFLVADNDAIILFSGFLKDIDYTKRVLNQKYFNVNFIEGQQLLDICKVSDGSCDQFLMIEAISIARMLEK